MSIVYLDYNASTPCDRQVIEAMQPYWSQFGNPHSMHHFGIKKQSVIDDCLEKLSTIYNCLPEDILFTSGATEANNLAIFSGIKLAKSQYPHKNVILTSHLEHKSVLEPLKVMAKTLNLNLLFVKLTADGKIDLTDFKEKVAQNQVLWLSVCMTNGEIGTNQPIKTLAQICHQHHITIHIDGSQAGYCELDFDGLNIDYLTISGHKLYAPCGIGLLISRHLNQLEPMIYGGGQQNGLRAGTLSLPLIVGMTKAVEILDECKSDEMTRLRILRDDLLGQLQSHCDVVVHGDLIDRHPANLHLAINGVDALQLLNHMRPYAAFSLSSACNGLNRHHSDLMKSLNISQKEVESSFRITVGRYTTQQEIDFVVGKFVRFWEA